MQIIQVLVTLQKGDAIGNNALLLADMLRKEGYQVRTHAYHIGRDLAFGTDEIYPIEGMVTPGKGDLVLYHMCEETPLNELLRVWSCKKIAIYHNVTPPKFFAWLDIDVAAKQQRSLREIASLRNTFDRVVADSSFNKEDLVQMGYVSKRIDVLPILIDFPSYQQAPDSRILRQLQDGYTNVLFVGRIAPNKKQEDVIRAFAWYKKHLNPNARLILIGSAFSEEYLGYLRQYIEKIDVKDVIFPGHISFPEILGYYKSASVFLSMSEHEGFCVPLVEAMLFDVPIVAFDSTAISSTLGGSGILLKRKDPVLAAKAIEQVMRDQTLRAEMIEGQRQRLRDFDVTALGNRFLKIVEEVC